VRLSLGLRHALMTRQQIAASSLQLREFLGGLPQLRHGKHLIQQIRGDPFTLLHGPRIASRPLRSIGSIGVAAFANDSRGETTRKIVRKNTEELRTKPG